MDQKQTPLMDYSMFQNTVTEEMRAKFFDRYPKYRKLNGHSIVVTSFIVIWIIISLIALIGGRFNFVVIPLAVFMGAIIAAAYYGWNKQLDNRVKLQTFADRNGLQYKFDQKEPSYSGLIFSEGHSRIIIESIIFPSYEVGNYQYVTGSGKNRQTHSYGYIKLNLQRPIPHIVLDAKQNDLFGLISNLPVSFNTSQTLELEGDFSKHFTLYVPETYERDALYILTPDVMASLIDESSPCDLEALGNELYLYRGQHFNLSSQEDHEAIAKHIHQLNTELVDQAAGYKDERVAFGTHTIAAQGAKLRTRIHPLTLLAGIFILGYFAVSYIIPLAMYLGS